jgi:hypothetical protein
VRRVERAAIRYAIAGGKPATDKGRIEFERAREKLLRAALALAAERLRS